MNSTIVTGAAGEHFVMFRLLSKGKIAALAPTGADAVDILVSDKTGAQLAAIQVKTAGDPVTIGWQMAKKHERCARDRLFFVFVSPSADPNGAPTCWIVPSAVVARHIADTHHAWLNEDLAPGKRARNDSGKRAFHVAPHLPPLPQYPRGWLDQYREAWTLLD